jgi:hypothetical protein
VAPVLAARCTEGCHEPGGRFPGLDLSSASGAFTGLVPRLVDPGRWRGTRFALAIRYRMPPGCFRRGLPPEWAPGGCPTRDEIKQIGRWVTLGAPDN